MQLLIDNEFIVNLLIFTMFIPYIQLIILLSVFFVGNFMNNLPNYFLNLMREFKELLNCMLKYIINIYDELDKSGMLIVV